MINTLTLEILAALFEDPGVYIDTPDGRCYYTSEGSAVSAPNMRDMITLDQIVLIPTNESSGRIEIAPRRASFPLHITPEEISASLKGYL